MIKYNTISLYKLLKIYFQYFFIYDISTIVYPDIWLYSLLICIFFKSQINNSNDRTVSKQLYLLFAFVYLMDVHHIQTLWQWAMLSIQHSK